MQVLYDESLEEPPAADRLRAMINTLASGAELYAAMPSLASLVCCNRERWSDGEVKGSANYYSR